MKKLEGRALICLSIVLFLILGTGIFIYRFVVDGSSWAGFYANQHIYKNGHLAMGKIYDVNGNLLMDNSGSEIIYNDSQAVREACLHVVGDGKGNIIASAEGSLQSKMVGYSLLTGVYSLNGRGDDLTLTIDQDLCVTALESLGGENGSICVYNYETGEVLVMVSTPTYDPLNPPTGDDVPDGAYINKVVSGRFVPGSIMKTVTSAAAIETVPGINDFTYDCSGVTTVSGEKLRCYTAHGHEDFYGALANSCNGAFGEITREVGATNMEKYVNRLGLTKSYNMDGIYSAKGKFEFPSDSPYNLSWAGIGQYHDMVNPLSMTVYMGAIANGGKAAMPKILHEVLGGTSYTDQMIEESTASQLQDMMVNDVTKAYGSYNFPGLDIGAKTGTAEIEGKNPNCWLVGFLRDKPLAFTICVENSPNGNGKVFNIANTVLQEAVTKVN